MRVAKNAGLGRKYHLLADQGPERTSGPHDAYWRTRDLATLCRRTVHGAPVSDTYADGSPIPVCRRCQRAARSA